MLPPYQSGTPHGGMGQASRGAHVSSQGWGKTSYGHRVIFSENGPISPSATLSTLKVNMTHRENISYLPDGSKKVTIHLENGRQITLFEPADKNDTRGVIVRKPSDRPRGAYKTWKDIPDDIISNLIYIRYLCPSCWCDNKRAPLTMIRFNDKSPLVCIFCDWTDMEVNADIAQV